MSAEIGRVVSEVSPWAPELQQLKRKRSYALARVQRLRADIGPRLDWCGTESLPVRCGCGYVGARKTCRQWWLCGDCRAKRARMLEADIRKGLELSLSAEIERWAREGSRGIKPQLVLITLTTRHSGNIVTDQAKLASGWRALYKRMHEEYGAFPYVGVWEVTKGKDGKGHVHMHIGVVWRWRCWKRIAKQWRRACPSSQRITFVAARKDKKASSPSSVAKYLGAYLAKGCNVNAFSPTMRADISAAFYNQRSVISSAHFFSRYQKCCRKCQLRYWLEEMPKPTLAELIPSGRVINLYFHGLEPPSNNKT